MAVCILPGVGTGAADKPFTVAVSIAPQADIVKQVGGDRVAVTILLPAGQSPELYDPSPRLMALLSEMDVYFTIGLPFETNLVRLFPKGDASHKVVDVDANLPRRSMQSHDAVTHESHGHETLDPHTWLDPIRVKAHATVVCRTLCDLDPGGCAAYNANLNRVLQKLDSLDRDIHAQLDSLADRRVYVFHPAYGYFTDRYNLKQIAIEMEGKEPSARQLAELLDRSKKENITALFVQPQFSRKTAATIADALGCQIVTLDPLAEDYFSNLGEMAHKIAATLSSSQTSTK